jgi:hypothetical protein
MWSCCDGSSCWWSEYSAGSYTWWKGLPSCQMIRCGLNSGIRLSTSCKAHVNDMLLWLKLDWVVQLLSAGCSQTYLEGSRNFLLSGNFCETCQSYACVLRYLGTTKDARTVEPASTTGYSSGIHLHIVLLWVACLYRKVRLSCSAHVLLLCKTQGICTLILDSVAQCMGVMINTCKFKPNFHGMWQDKKIKKLQHDLEITKLCLSKVCIPCMWNMLGW